MYIEYNLMLTKVNNLNIEYGTNEIICYSKINNFKTVQDNLDGLLLVNTENKTYLYDYIRCKKINFNRIPIKINDFVIWKQIDSFDQNNPKIANKIRNQVLLWINNDKSSNLLGIGGEYYIYFKLTNYKKCIGMSNHMSIISDSKYNLQFNPEYKNYFVDYNNLKSYPNLNEECYDIIINVVNIHENIIKYISNINFKKLILITCKPLEKKIKMLNKYLKLVKLKHFLNVNSWITLCVFTKKV